LLNECITAVPAATANSPMGWAYINVAAMEEPKQIDAVKEAIETFLQTTKTTGSNLKQATNTAAREKMMTAKPLFGKNVLAEIWDAHKRLIEAASGRFDAYTLQRELAVQYHVKQDRKLAIKLGAFVRDRLQDFLRTALSALETLARHKSWFLSSRNKKQIAKLDKLFPWASEFSWEFSLSVGPAMGWLLNYPCKVVHEMVKVAGIVDAALRGIGHDIIDGVYSPVGGLEQTCRYIELQ